MKRSDTTWLSVICYFIPVLGPIYLLVRRRDSRFARVHGQQMLALPIALLILFVAWAVVAWLLAGIPTAGPLVGAMLFALVIAALIAAVVIWFFGLLQALRGRVVRLPIIWGVSKRLFAASE